MFVSVFQRDPQDKNEFAFMYHPQQQPIHELKPAIWKTQICVPCLPLPPPVQVTSVPPPMRMPPQPRPQPLNPSATSLHPHRLPTARHPPALDLAFGQLPQR
jgi:hypothetical protein